jgi:GDSL-like Lipase/Acylhydrolase family
MTRSAAFLVLAGALGGALAVASATPAAPSRSVLSYGDSLSVGTDLYLGRYLHGWTVRSLATVSTHADAVPGALRSFGPSLPRVVVVSAGTNDDPGRVSGFARLVRESLAVAGAHRCVVWSTIVRPPYGGVSYDGYNRVLRSLARTHANLHVFDWDVLARAHPSWFGSDGVHPSMTGYRVRASATASLVRRAC